MSNYKKYISILKQKFVNSLLYLMILLVFNMGLNAKGLTKISTENIDIIHSKIQFVNSPEQKFFHFQDQIWHIDNILELDEENKVIAITLGEMLYDFEKERVLNYNPDFLFSALFSNEAVSR